MPKSSADAGGSRWTGTAWTAGVVGESRYGILNRKLDTLGGSQVSSALCSVLGNVDPLPEIRS
ncbi:MAG: hypothetical protein NTX48_15945 [Planctomycetales bacterium]|nr:hypothetical protein [Planctomycetales bacterium]